MQTKVFKRNYLKAVYSALCVLLALVCITFSATPTFCAEVNSASVVTENFYFPVSSFYLTITGVDVEMGTDYYTPDDSGGIITYVDVPGSYVTNTHFDTFLNFDDGYGILDVEEFKFSLNFGAYQPYSDTTTIFDNILHSTVSVNGVEFPLTVDSFDLNQISGSEYSVYVVFSCDSAQLAEVLTGVNDDVRINLLWEPNYVYNPEPFYFSFVFHGANLVLSYTERDRDNQRVPITPEEQEVLDGMNQSKEEMEQAGSQISDAVNDLESMIPEVGDPFENAPDLSQNIIGFQFFSQWFGYLYASEITGAFISFGLVMALIVFIMRR